MKPTTIAAIPAIAIAAGISLAACGSQAANNSAAPAETHSAPAKPVATHSAVAKPAVPVIGQPVRDGSFTVTVTQFKCVAKIVQPSTDGTSEPDNTNTPTRGQFCVALYKMVNNTHQPQSASIDGVLSASGNTYRTTEDFTAGTNADYQFYGPNYESSSDVNPGESASDVFVWDVPVGIHPQSVTLTPSDGSDSSATVSVNS